MSGSREQSSSSRVPKAGHSEGDEPAAVAGTGGTSSRGPSQLDASTGRSTEANSGKPAAPSSASSQRDGDEDAGAAAMAPDMSATSPSLAQTGWQALVDWEALPVLGRSDVAMFTSREREGTGPWLAIDPGNKDLNNFLAVCGTQPTLYDQYVDRSVECAPGDDGYLLAAADGPGYISRIALAVGPNSLKPTDELIRIYIDDAETPTYEGRWLDWYDGSEAPFVAPLTGWFSGMIVNYVPFSYQRKLRVFANNLHAGDYYYYYQVTTHSVEKTAPFDKAALLREEAGRELKAGLDAANMVPDAKPWADELITLQAGGEQTVWTRDTPGTLTKLTLELDEANAQQVLSQVSLRLTWEDETNPAVDVTLADLFGARLETSELETLPMSVHKDNGKLQLQLRLPMPFRARARLTLAAAAEATGGIKVQAHAEGVDRTPRGAWGHLQTTVQQRTRANQGDRYVVAELDGPGKYVGTMMHMVGGPNSFSILPEPGPFNFLEGDEQAEIDGSSYGGTGSEESFNGGWYFSDGPFTAAFSALIHKQERDKHGEVSAVRWYILSDSLPFQDHFRLSYEYGANRPETTIEYVSVGFYYR
ncbi:MAG TPA: DUF2961 domain-containing protein [Polyangiales bacterium]|nr:DUF2961 domain-containing protein [Polyangiales bacterium]